MTRKTNTIILLSFLLNFALLKKEAELEFKNQLIDYYKKGDLNEEDIKAFKSITKTRFESFELNNTNDIIKASMEVQKAGKYKINCEQTMIWLYDAEGKLISNFEENDNVYLLNNNIYAQFLHLGSSEEIKVNIVYLNEFNLPFDPIKMKDKSKFDTSSIATDPLKFSEMQYKKREGNYLYIYSNNPEAISDDNINKAFIRKDISNKEVFFTFEHGTINIQNTLYSGFQVRNTGDSNLQVKIKNIGFQYDGKGKWLGQKEWMDFFGINFKLKNMDKWNEDQRKRFEDYFNFSEDYKPTPFQTRTYTIPPGKYFYVIGGTTEDAYGNYNVFDTANKDIHKTVINGVVLFEVTGNAEGAFFVYNDISIPQSDKTSHQGYVSEKGSQYIGYDNCNGVVDNSMTWEFNDLTKAQLLPVRYKVNYKPGAPIEGQTPYSKIETEEHTFEGNPWVTHLNPHNHYPISETNKGVPVGKDMAKFITVKENGEEITLDNEHYDGKGNIGNFGNWMIDYIDNFNFVNRGDKQRTVSISLYHGYQGSLACFIRNSKLEVIEGTEQNTIICPYSYPIGHENHKDDKIAEGLYYNLTVEPHSVAQIYLEYVNLANSYGNLTHTVYLNDIENDNNNNNLGSKIRINLVYIILLLIELSMLL